MFPWDKPAQPNKKFNGNAYTDAGMNFRIQQRRMHESQVKDLNKYVKASKGAVYQAECDRRIANGRSRNQALQRAGEAAMSRNYEKAQTTMRTQSKRDQDIQLARTLAEMEKEKQRKEREIRKIVDNDPTVRALKAKIQAAYMNKDRERQQRMKAEISKREKEEEKIFVEEQIKNQKGLLKAEQEKQERRARMAEQQKIEIQAQLKAKENRERLRQIKEYQREKLAVDKLVQDIYKQTAKEQEQALRRQQEIKEMMDLGFAQQMAARAQREEEEKRHELEIQNYRKVVAHRNDEKIALKKAKEEAQEKIRQRLEEEAFRKLQQEKEMRDALEVLRKEHEERRLEQEAAAKINKKIRLRSEMMAANRDQMKEKAILAAQRKAEEEEVIRRMKAKFAEDDRIAEEKERIRRENDVTYRKDITDQMALRNQMFHEAQKVDVINQQKRVEEQKWREQVVEEARLAILREHAQKLKGFLPKGVLEKESDLEVLSIFDTDGDNVLSSTEVAAAKSRLLKYGDVDGDGMLNADERTEAFQRLKQQANNGRSLHTR